jgi:hypothetical protein
MWGAAAAAHRRDEYLQAARVAIDPARVEIALDLTPGIAVAQPLVKEIDRDGSGSISAGEARVYAERVLSAIVLDVDDLPLRLELIDSVCPGIDEILKGEGTTRIRAAAKLPRLANGLHRLRYRNSFRRELGVYLANALVPATDRVVVAAQRRDVDQRELLVDYELRNDSTITLREGLPAALGGALILLGNLWWRQRAHEEM